jgi:antirestriction protein
MNKIMKALLEAKYPTLNADTLLEIASMTPNAQLAVEKLSGIYEPCTIVEGDCKYYSINSNDICTVTSVDEWNYHVYYNRVTEKTISFYIDEDADIDAITIENYKQYERQYQKDMKRRWFTLRTGTTELMRGCSCSINDWIDRPDISSNMCE